jgi:dihydrolipoamide dehydrogenase
VVVLEAMPSILTESIPTLWPVSRAAKAFRKSGQHQSAENGDRGKQIKVTMEIDKQQREELYDESWSVSAAPELRRLRIENTRVTKDDKGFIKCNPQQQTDDPDIYAIGDVNGGTCWPTALRKKRESL